MVRSVYRNKSVEMRTPSYKWQDLKSNLKFAFWNSEHLGYFLEEINVHHHCTNPDVSYTAIDRDSLKKINQQFSWGPSVALIPLRMVYVYSVARRPVGTLDVSIHVWLHTYYVEYEWEHSVIIGLAKNVYIIVAHSAKSQQEEEERIYYCNASLIPLQMITVYDNKNILVDL